MPRIKELDFLKGVLILLVIAFHLVWFEQLHPDIKQVVYCFHMPGFLLISGYLMNISKAPRQFLRTLLWLAVPYVVMESGYVFMASILPINEHIPQLTPWVYLKHLFLHPLGPYWYLHAIILCGALYYYIYNNVERGMATRFLLIGIAYYILARIFGILSFSSALYFLAGACLRQSGMNFVAFFLPSRLSVIVFALLACFSAEPTQASLNGVLIAYFAISSLLSLYTITPPKGGMGIRFLGRNSLPLYVFSPIFTVLCKQLVPYLKFDPTGLLFLVVSLTFCVTGSLLIAWLMDLVGVSRFFFGRRALN
jgi:fucose 4-O-acetylase-like acetyltransferase